ncbi:hypothetical protein K8I85_13505, partial [bacterium]|nr:hypothetical protein [bacterium]
APPVPAIPPAGARALHRFGAPAHRLEGSLEQAARDGAPTGGRPPVLPSVHRFAFHSVPMESVHGFFFLYRLIQYRIRIDLVPTN